MNCPHCHSEPDTVINGIAWTCGVRKGDPTHRKLDCYRRELDNANERIKRLEEALDRIIEIRAVAQGAGQYLTLDAIERVAKTAKEAKP